jgi:hypothetical protein
VRTIKVRSASFEVRAEKMEYNREPRTIDVLTAILLKLK